MIKELKVSFKDKVLACIGCGFGFNQMLKELELSKEDFANKVVDDTSLKNAVVNRYGIKFLDKAEVKSTNNKEDKPKAPAQLSEKQVLMARAKELGVKVWNAINIEQLKKGIAEKEANNCTSGDDSLGDDNGGDKNPTNGKAPEEI